MSQVPTLTELCFDVVINNLDTYTNLNEVLPVELKERIFVHYTIRIPSTPVPPPFPVTTYPEDRYRFDPLLSIFFLSLIYFLCAQLCVGCCMSQLFYFAIIINPLSMLVIHCCSFFITEMFNW